MWRRPSFVLRRWVHFVFNYKVPSWHALPRISRWEAAPSNFAIDSKIRGTCRERMLIETSSVFENGKFEDSREVTFGAFTLNKNGAESGRYYVENIYQQAKYYKHIMVDVHNWQQIHSPPAENTWSSSHDNAASGCGCTEQRKCVSFSSAAVAA